MTDLNFAGKQVLVVGGSSGIGNATARAFKAAGADVMVTGTRASPAEYGPEQAVDFEGLAYSRLDVSNSAMLADWDPGLTRLDVMVLSQGSVEYGRREFEPETFRRIVEINLNSQIDCATKLKPLLSDSEGSIITISSVGGLRATIANPAYAASKAGVIHLTRVLGAAWARDGIRVNGIAPGLVETKMISVTSENPERLAARVAGIPLRRIGQADEIASIALFLASPMASYIVGHTIVADGGRTLN
ncbi:SDR family NAD(P)-dependent oxidoreductase [Novosphingobium colocasiae]|uniref:Oxidoreductase n=1 Tax=Novosphingobium colocasiae TaxID=1256513 RepID=A0A918PP25_9SPHN|nr:SDR family oxidoreductase [Novosphingobium colocasiae]GGZ17511.1 oxidoreductase [Novosphingobium colocasiae]